MTIIPVALGVLLSAPKFKPSERVLVPVQELLTRSSFLKVSTVSAYDAVD